jgi:hypothetical protein
VFLILCSGYLFAQQPKSYKITNGPEMEAARNSVEDVVGATSAGTVVIRKQKRDLFLELISDRGAVTKSLPMSDLQHNGLDKTLQSGVILDGRLYLRFGAYDKKTKKVHVLVEEYDPKTLKMLRSAVNESYSVEGARGAYFFSMGDKKVVNELTENGFDVSGQRNYLVEYTSDFSKDGDEAEKVNLYVFNSEYALVWKKDYTLPYPNDMFTIRDVIVDDSGNAYMIGRLYLEKGDRKRGQDTYEYHVLTFKNEGAEVNDLKMELPGVYFTDLTIGVNSQGNMMAIGFYSKDKDKYGIDGTVGLVLDGKSGQIISNSKREFDGEFIRMGMTEKEEKKADKKEKKGEDLEMPDFDLDKIVFTEDGGCVLVAEQFYLTTRTITTSGPNGTLQTRTETVYNYDDIIAVKLDAAGNILWNVKIPKSQSSANPLRLSYELATCGNDIILVYNRYEDKKMSVNATTITADGQVESEVIMRNEKDELQVYPRYSDRLDNCRMMLYLGRGKVYQFSLLEKLH